MTLVPRPFLGLTRPVIGVVHLQPLPGAPRFGGDLAAVLRRARSDAAALARGGVDALIVENLGDAPFEKEAVAAETIAAMTRIASAIRSEHARLPLGINCLRNDARAALGIAIAVGAQFIRVNIHTGAAVADQGIIEGRAAETLRVRAALGVDVKILADVHVKHARPLAAVPLAEAVCDTVERGLADGIIVTGPRTGSATALDDIRVARDAAPGVPVFVGSGVNRDNVGALLPEADGLIVGTAFERAGRSGAVVDGRRVRGLVAAARRACRQVEDS